MIDRYYSMYNQSLRLVKTSFSFSFFMLASAARIYGLPPFPLLVVSWFFSRRVCLFFLIVSNLDLLFLPYGMFVLVFFLVIQALFLELFARWLSSLVGRRIVISF